VSAQPHVRVERGDGLVARFGEVVVFLAQSAAEAGIEEVLLRVETAASGDPSGTNVATSLAAVVAGAREDVPAFGVVAPLADGWVVLLFGPVWAEISRKGAHSRFSGDQAVTWVDHKVLEPFDAISIGSSEPPLQVDPRSDLRAGIVTGSGFVLTPSPSHAAEPTEAAGGPPTLSSPEARPTPPDALSVAEPATRSSAGAPPPIPAERPEPISHPSAPARATVVPGAAPTLERPEPEPQAAQTTAERETGPARETIEKPADGAAQPQRVPQGATVVVTLPVGFLVASDGMRIPLDRAYVLGREPEDDPAVTTGEATPVRLNDEDNLISRVQSHIAIKDGQVLLRDAGSSNGTFVAKPGDEDWTRIGPDGVTLPPEWSMRVGKLVFTHVVMGDAS
jgi:hypothetical protein